MTDQHRATPGQWEYVRDKAWEAPACESVSSCLLELRARVEALEAARVGGPLTEVRYQRLKALTEGVEIDHDAPADSLVERVIIAGGMGLNDCRAAIRAVAAWCREQHPSPGMAHVALRLEQEAASE